MLIYRSHDVQLFGFTPLGNPRGREQAVGVALRVRSRGRWRHFSLRVYWPRRDLRVARGTVALEGKSWLAGPGPNDKLTIKAFVRLKVGLGGPRSSAQGATA